MTSSPCIDEIDVRELIPQRDPMIMVGRLMHFDQKTALSSTLIEPECIFVEDGRLSACGIIENIAQSCALRLGYYNKYIQKSEVQIGYIGAIRHMEILSLPRVGETLTTSVTTVEEIFGMSLVEAKVMVGDREIAHGNIKIALSHTPMKG